MSTYDPERQRNWRTANAEQLRAYEASTSRRAAKQRRYNERCLRVADIKSARGCTDCSERDADCLDFDHRDPSTKLFDIGTWGEGRAWKIVLAEIAKCDVRCANCHRKKSKREWHSYRGGKCI